MTERDAKIAELVQQARAGQEQAIMKLLNEYRNLFRSISRKYQDMKVEHKDLYQQIYQEFIILLKEYHPETGIFFGHYVKKFLRYRVDRHLKELTPIPVSASCTYAEPSILPLQYVYDEQGERLSRLLKNLPDQERNMLNAKFWQGKSEVEIASESGKTQQSINRLKKNVMARLKQSLAGPKLQGIYKSIKLSELEFRNPALEDSAGKPSLEIITLYRSIREIGLLHPVVVQLNPENNRYQVICGNRRAIAARWLNPEKEIHTVVYEGLDFSQRLSLYLAENFCRKDLKSIEIGLVCSYLKNNAHMCHEQISRLLKISPKSIQRCLRLLKLSQPVMKALIDGRIEFWDALLLGKVDDAVQSELLNEVITNNLTTRQIKERVRDITSKNKSSQNIRLPQGVRLKRLSSHIWELQINYYSDKSKLVSILRRLLEIIKYYRNFPNLNPLPRWERGTDEKQKCI